MKILTNGSVGFEQMNVNGLLELQEQFSIGGLGFNAYVVAGGNIHTDTLNTARTEVSSVLSYMAVEESETGFYIVSGKGGTQGGKCERFSFPAESGLVLRVWLRHPKTGNVVPEGLIRGLRFISSTELQSQAHAKRDLRRFIVSGDEGFTVTGAVVGSMGEKRQVIVYASENGLDAVCITTGKIGSKENAVQAVEAGALSEEEKLGVAMALFAGVDVEKGKTLTRNATRKARKALRG